MRIAIAAVAALFLFGLATEARATFIVLDATSNFTAEIEPGATISQPAIGRAAVTAPGEGPLLGTGTIFACGTSDVADFSDFSNVLGGGARSSFTLCNDRPRTVIVNETQFTIEVLSDSTLWNLDLLSPGEQSGEHSTPDSRVPLQRPDEITGDSGRPFGQISLARTTIRQSA